MKKVVFAAILIVFLSAAANASADIVGEKRRFFVEPSYFLIVCKNDIELRIGKARFF